MASARRDYYDILGVEPGASDKEIKSAFRRLARELHPDVSDHPEAQERFREAAEAYEVLSKPETRELYDRYGHEGLRTGGFRPSDFTNIADLFSAFFGDELFGGAGLGSRRARGADVMAEVAVELEEAARGVKREVRIPVSVPCETCGATGAAPGTTPRDLPGLRRERAAPVRLVLHLRPVHPNADVSRVQWSRRGRGDTLSGLQGNPAQDGGAGARDRCPARDSRRPAHPPLRRGPCRGARGARG